MEEEVGIYPWTEGTAENVAPDVPSAQAYIGNFHLLVFLTFYLLNS